MCSERGMTAITVQALPSMGIQSSNRAACFTLVKPLPLGRLLAVLPSRGHHTSTQPNLRACHCLRALRLDP